MTQTGIHDKAFTPEIQRFPMRSLLVALGMAALLACGKSPNATGEAYRSTEPAAFAIKTVTSTAAVKSIDYPTRTLVLGFPDGTTRTYKVGNDVVNFNQIHVGDQVRATIADALAVNVRKAGEPPNEGDRFTVALAPEGAKPGIMFANTVEDTARINAIDPAARTLTLTEPDGATRTLKVAPTVQMAQLKKGDDVVVRSTEAMALVVQKP